MKTRFTHFICRSLVFAVLLQFQLLGIQAQTTHHVNVSSDAFSPSVISIAVGDEVTWTNSEGFHNVNGTTGAYPDNPESFGNSTGNGWTFSHTFNIHGVYDYHCDPHVNLGMVGQVIVEAPPSVLTINFSGMNPHVGQDIWVRLEEAASGDEIFRGSDVVETSFSMVIPGIEAGNDYIVEMYADHNGNGHYDAPGDDHAWQLELNDVDGNETVDFVHNTNFTDIEWEHAATVQLSGMNPHIGQEIYFALIESVTGKVVDRKSELASESFSVVLDELVPGIGYQIDFFADHNGNGYYDAPADDHAWRLEIESANGDEIFDFSHNTNFTDIEWMHRLRVRFAGMNPHIGQMMQLFVRDQTTGATLDSVIVATIENADFEIESYNIEVGGSYHVDFYADMNENGVYDAPPTDHAWRLVVSNAMGDVDLDFSHNTTFTDIMETGSTFSVPVYAEKGFKVYPNPFTHQVTVTSETIIHSAEILSVSGAVMKSYSGINTLQRTISLDEFSAGVYFLKVRTGQAEDAFVRIVKR